MSKFKVGDKVVVCGGDIRTIARIDKWLDNEYGYYFNIDDELLNYYKEEDLELYKTPHERLLELGYVAKVKQGNLVQYELVVNEDKWEKHSIVIQIYPDHKEFSIWRLIKNHSTGSITTDILFIKKNLAEILVEYLEELK